MIIEDGLTGKTVEVDSSNRLKVKAVIEDEFVSAIENGEGYVWTNATYDYDASDTILLVKNDNSKMNLLIKRIVMSSDAATYATIHSPTAAFTATGTTVTGVNLNLTSGKIAVASSWADESGNVQGKVFRRPAMPVANTDYTVDFGEGVVILGNGQSIGVDYITTGTACRVSIYGYFDEIE